MKIFNLVYILESSEENETVASNNREGLVYIKPKFTETLIFVLGKIKRNLIPDVSCHIT